MKPGVRHNFKHEANNVQTICCLSCVVNDIETVELYNCKLMKQNRESSTTILLYNPTPNSQDHHGGRAQVEKVSH